MKFVLYDNHFDEAEEDAALITDLHHKLTVIMLVAFFIGMMIALIWIGQWFVCFVLSLVGKFAYDGMRY